MNINHLLNTHFDREKPILRIFTSFLIRNYVNRGGLDLSKEVLWVSEGQRAAKLQVVKVRGWKKNSATRPESN